MQHSAAPERIISRDGCYVSEQLTEKAVFSLRRNKALIGIPVAGSALRREPSTGVTLEELAFVYLCKLIPWAHKYAPLIAIDKELLDAYRTQSLMQVSSKYFGLILDISGTQKLHGSEQALVQRISRALSRKEIAHRLTISPCVGASWACSRYSRQACCIIERKDLQEYLSPLPPAALRLPQESLDLLQRLGITSVGKLLEFPTHALASRFGAMVVERIEQALDQRIEPLQCARYKEIFKVERLFDVPIVTHLTLQTVVSELFEELIDELARKQKVAGSFFAELYPYVRREIAKPFVKQFALFQASNRKEHIFSVVGPWIESIRANDGIKRIVIEAKFTKNDQSQQTDFYDSQKGFAPLPELLNQLVIRLGKNHVAKIFFEESHIPERSFGYVSVMQPAPRYDTTPRSTERPSYLFQQPEQITALALLPDHPPAWISWRGEKLTISKSLGPERISPEWWLGKELAQASNDTRDYFKLQDQHGRWLWVYRTLPGMEWYVHGMWN